MPITLYKYILREILKLLATSTGILMIVMSFGAAIKPISEGLLDPFATIKVILYTMPGMLTFALPFGAIFASTIVFFRMSNDNEVTACAVSGLSYREILMPILGLAVVLTLSMFYLSNWVVPKFWHAVARLVEQDVTKLMIAKIERQEPIAIGSGVLLYADSARAQELTPENMPTGKLKPHNRMILNGVAVVKINYQQQRPSKADPSATPTEQLNVSGELTAAQAIVDLYIDPDSDRTYVTLLLKNVVMNDARSGTLIAAEKQPIQAQEIESPFQQKPKFLSLPRLRKVSKNPDRSVAVRKQKSKLVNALAAHQTAKHIADELTANPDEDIELTAPNGEVYTLRAPSISYKDDRVYLKSTENRKIRISSQINGLTHQRITAESAQLKITANQLTDEPTISIELTDATIADPTLPTRTVQRSELFIPLLSIDQQILAPLRLIPSQELITQTKPITASSVAETRDALLLEIEELYREITGALHERAAFAINCLLVLLLGAVMSMTLRQEIPLVIFFWSFLPAVISILTITSGQTVFSEVENHPAIGMIVTWSGNFALMFLIALVYRKLRRN